MKSLCTNICETNKKAWLSEKCGITGSPESVLGMMAFGTMAFPGVSQRHQAGGVKKKRVQILCMYSPV